MIVLLNYIIFVKKISDVRWKYRIRDWNSNTNYQLG